MPKYIVENTRTEEISEHKSWGGAMRAAAKYADPTEVRIVERDRDGEREYNAAGLKLRSDGHYR